MIFSQSNCFFHHLGVHLSQDGFFWQVIRRKKDSMITTERKNGFFFVRFTSDLVTECDVVSIKFALQQALATGTRNIALSVVVGSLLNQRFISRLLRQCKELVHRENGNLFFVELGDATDSMYHAICDALEIPLFDSEDKIDAAVTLPVMA